MSGGIQFGARTDIGCVREGNEDSYASAPDLNLFVLSDGMGGLACGEVASKLAVETVVGELRHGKTSLPRNGDLIVGDSAESNRLVAAIRAANQAIHQAAKARGVDQPMGATIVAVQFCGGRMSIAHVGDSRIYRLRGGQLEQLTRDHSFVAEQVRQGRMTEQEAGRSGLQNVLVRALGIAPDVEVDVSEELVLENDTVLLCSDGLTRELTDAQIAAVIEDCHDVQDAADQLVDAAKLAGGGDNITALVVRPAAKSAGALARMGRLGKWLKISTD